MDKNYYFEQIKQDFSVYKFYMEFLLKAGIFIFGITGGIVSYYFAHTDQELMKYSLILPLLFNFVFCLACFGSLKTINSLIIDQYRLSKKAGIIEPYEMTPLKYLIVIFGIVYGLSAVGLVGIIISASF